MHILDYLKYITDQKQSTHNLSISWGFFPFFYGNKAVPKRN